MRSDGLQFYAGLADQGTHGPGALADADFDPEAAVAEELPDIEAGQLVVAREVSFLGPLRFRFLAGAFHGRWRISVCCGRLADLAAKLDRVFIGCRFKPKA